MKKPNEIRITLREKSNHRSTANVVIFSSLDYGGADEYEGSGGSDNGGCGHSDDEDCYTTGLGSGEGGGAATADGSGDGQSDVSQDGIGDVMKSANGDKEYDPYHPPLPTPAPPVENSLDNSSHKGKSLLQATFVVLSTAY